MTLTHLEELTSYHRIRHIMTPKQQFTWLDAQQPCVDEKKRLLAEGYSQAPLQRGDDVLLVPAEQLPDTTTLVEAWDDARRAALPGWLSAEDELRYAPQFFLRQKAYLVRHNAEVVGLVHYSDLNKLAFRSCVYHQIAALEAALLAHVERVRPQPEEWEGLINDKAIADAKKRFAKGTASAAGLTPAMELYLPDLVKLCGPELREKLGCETEFECCVVTPINELRKRIAHIGKPVLNSYAKIKDLTEQLQQIEKVRAILAEQEQ